MGAWLNLNSAFCILPWEAFHKGQGVRVSSGALASFYCLLTLTASLGSRIQEPETPNLLDCFCPQWDQNSCRGFPALRGARDSGVLWSFRVKPYTNLSTHQYPPHTSKVHLKVYKSEFKRRKKRNNWFLLRDMTEKHVSWKQVYRDEVRKENLLC